MFEKLKNKTRCILAISIVVMLLSAVISGAMQTNFGKVTMQEVDTVYLDRQILSGMLYIPDTATVENPAPAIIIFHGWWKSKEIESPS